MISGLLENVGALVRPCLMFKSCRDSGERRVRVARGRGGGRGGGRAEERWLLLAYGLGAVLLFLGTFLTFKEEEGFLMVENSCLHTPRLPLI
jgi:hypothetical protein